MVEHQFRLIRLSFQIRFYKRTGNFFCRRIRKTGHHRYQLIIHPARCLFCYFQHFLSHRIQRDVFRGQCLVFFQDTMQHPFHIGIVRATQSGIRSNKDNRHFIHGTAIRYSSLQELMPGKKTAVFTRNTSFVDKIQKHIPQAFFIRKDVPQGRLCSVKFCRSYFLHSLRNLLRILYRTNPPSYVT